MGIVAQALGRPEDQQEEQQEPVDNPQEEAAEAGQPGAAGWNGDKVLQTATQLAFESLYSDGGIKALENRLGSSENLPADMADIAANLMASAMQKAQANQRTIPGDALQKLAMTLVYELLQVAGIMGLVPQQQAKAMAKQILPAALQAFQQKQQQPQQQAPQGMSDAETGEPNNGQAEELQEGGQ